MRGLGLGLGLQRQALGGAAAGGGAPIPDFAETWDSLDAWTKENDGNRAVVNDLANHYAAVEGTTDAFCTDRATNVVLPDVFTLDFVVNKTANWFSPANHAGFAILADAVALTGGLGNVTGGEDGYHICVRSADVEIYRYAAGVRTKVYDEAITLAAGVNNIRVRVDASGGDVQIHVYLESAEIGSGYTDASPPAGLGTGLVAGVAYSPTTGADKSHMGAVKLYYSDLGAPS